MKRVILLVMLTAMVGFSAYSQSTYKSAIGLRVGSVYYDDVSASFKFFVAAPSAIELNLGFGSRGYAFDNRSGAVHFSGAYQHHFNIPVNGLRWFIGGGAVVYSAFADNDFGQFRDDYRGFGAGIFPTGGIDYKFAKIPLNLSADIRPTFMVSRPDYYDSFEPNVGVAVRYTIGQRAR